MAISKNQIKFVRQLEHKKFRRSERLFVAEGTKVVGDLLAHYQPRAIFATSDWIADHQGKYQIQEVTADELQRLSFLQHPQQVLALFPIPSSPDISPSSLLPPHSSNLAIALDGIQDPGNLGTIIRIADWFGITQIFCSEDTLRSIEIDSPACNAELGGVSFEKAVITITHRSLLSRAVGKIMRSLKRKH